MSVCTYVSPYLRIYILFFFFLLAPIRSYLARATLRSFLSFSLLLPPLLLLPLSWIFPQARQFAAAGRKRRREPIRKKFFFSCKVGGIRFTYKHDGIYEGTLLRILIRGALGRREKGAQRSLNCANKENFCFVLKGEYLTINGFVCFE